jgi:hypothetical protein
MKHQKEKQYLIDKFNGLDSIVKELKEDVLGLLLVLLCYGFIALFFGSIDNCIWQEIFQYVKYCVVFINVFMVLDLVLTMFKLIEINAELNKIAVIEREK